jgi:hypothetical protein
MAEEVYKSRCMHKNLKSHIIRAVIISDYCILFGQQIYSRLKISSTTWVVVAVPPKSGLSNFPSSKLPSTAA